MTIHIFLSLLAGIILAAFAGSQGKGQDATPKIVQESPFTVIGISARTTNAKEMSGQGVIGKQWNRVMKENLLSKIPNRADSSIIAVYTDYESDANGAYTFILGAKASSTEKIPSGMVAVKIPAGKYALFISDRGPVNEVVPQTWGRIWSAPKSTLGGVRAYKADYELYGPRAADPQNAEVEIYVGVK